MQYSYYKTPTLEGFILTRYLESETFNSVSNDSDVTRCCFARRQPAECEGKKCGTFSRRAIARRLVAAKLINLSQNDAERIAARPRGIWSVECPRSTQRFRSPVPVRHPAFNKVLG